MAAFQQKVSPVLFLSRVGRTAHKEAFSVPFCWGDLLASWLREAGREERVCGGGGEPCCVEKNTSLDGLPLSSFA